MYNKNMGEKDGAIKEEPLRLSEKLLGDIDKRVVYSDNVTEIGKGIIRKKIEDEALNVVRGKGISVGPSAFSNVESAGTRMEELTEEGKEVLSRYLDKFNQFLDQVGFDDSVIRPTLDNMVVYRSTDPNLTTNGRCDTAAPVAILFLPEGMGWNDPRIEGLVIHESFHLINKILVSDNNEGRNLTEEGVVILENGLQRKKTDSVDSGVFAEPVAEIGTSYILPEEASKFGLAYPERDAFTMALLERLSDINGTTIEEEYRELLKAMVSMDRSYYGLVSSYLNSAGVFGEGNEGFIKSIEFETELEGIKTSNFGHPKMDDLFHVAFMGGFEENLYSWWETCAVKKSLSKV